jgi:hypothetical protein
MTACEIFNECPTRWVSNYLCVKQDNDFREKYSIRTENGKKIRPHDAAEFGRIVLTGEYCNGDPSYCPALAAYKAKNVKF